MKSQVFLAFSVLAAVTAQASAQTAETRHAAASPAVTAPEPCRSAQAAIAGGTSGRRAVRCGRREATDPPRAPRRAAPAGAAIAAACDLAGAHARDVGHGQSAGRSEARTPRQPQYQQSPGYTARPNNRLLFGRFYSKIPRQTVAFPGNYAPGTIIVRHREKRLYYVLGNGQAIQYGVAVGREGAGWSGTSTVSNKREWPSWTPTPAILARQPNLPRHMEGGPENPMGARALYLGDTLYRIHGTNEPWMIGAEVSSGCIRMTNEDVIDLYDRTRMGAKVIVIR